MKPEELQALREALEYLPDRGVFLWKIATHGNGGAIEPSDEAGTPKDGYIQIGFRGRIYRRARLAWLFMTGEFPPKGFDVDHRNTKRCDDRWSNLRLRTRSQNNHNTIRLRPDNTTGHRGVFRGKKPGTWFARITYEGRVIHLGTFDTIEAAVAARKAGLKEHKLNV